MTRKSIEAQGLTPGINYIVKVFSSHTDAQGQTIVSEYSSPIQITTPGLAAGGGNLSATNFKTDMRLSGGSFYVGTFKGTKGVISLVNGSGVPITLTSTESGLIINKYGIAAYNAGVPEFTLDAISGRAIFAGRVQAGTIKIGPKVDPTGTKNGIYINTKNYWYDDGTFKVNAQDVAKSLEGSDGGTNPQVTPTGVTNFAGTWNTTTGATLRLTWDFDDANENNAFVKEFIILFTSGGTTKSVTVLATERIFDLTETINKSLFVFFKDTFTSIGIFANPKYGSPGPVVYLATIPTYVSSLAAPLSLSVVPINNGYTVTYTKPTSSAYGGVTIEETTISPGTSGFGAVPASSEVKSSSDPTKNIVTVMTSDLEQRWVRARFYDNNGTFTGYSPTYEVTPNSSVVINTSAPGNVTVYSDSVIFQTYNSVAYAGDDLDVYFDIPSTGSGDTFVVKLTPTGVARNGYFYFTKTTFPSVSSASGNGSGTIVYTTASAHGLQIGKKVTVGGFSTAGYNVSNKTISAITTSSPYTFTVTSAGNQTGASSGTGNILTQYGTINSNEMRDQVGGHYSSFTGFLISIGSNGVENTSPPSITVPSRVSSLSSYKPVIRTIAISNGFSSTYSLVGTNAVRAEIYYRYSSWAGVTNPIDYYSGTYSSGGANAATSLLITGVTDNNGNTIAPLSGYPISGTGMQAGTYVASVTGTGPYTLNLSKPLNAQASGTYTASALVYSGLSPANIFTSVYDPTYVIGRYFDDYDIVGSLVSDQTVVTPIDAGAVDENAPDVATSSVYAGGSAYPPTYNTLTVGIATTDTTTRAYLIKYKIGSGRETIIRVEPIEAFVSGSSLTIKVIKGLLPSKTYTISIASVDQFDNISAYSSTFTGTTTAAPAGLIATSASFTDDGAFINDYNYWYSNGDFAAGADGNGISWNGTTFAVTGKIKAKSGSFSGNVYVENNAGIIAGSASSTITGATTDGTKITYTTSSTHGLIVGNVVSVYDITPSEFNVMDGTITDITTNTFKVAKALTGHTYTSGGYVATSRITLTNSALNVYDSGNNKTTTIYANATAGTTIDNLTFKTTNAQIADWRISSTGIENTITTPSKYTGLSASKTDYAFWAGATSAGNTDSTAPFSVTPLGQLNASNVKITGGQLDVGSSSYATKPSAIASTGATTISMSNTATADTVAISSVPAGTSPNFTTYFVSGTNIALGTTGTISGTTLTLSKPTTGGISITDVIKLLAYSGAHITSQGNLFVKDGVFIGDINAASGTFTGNISLTGANGSLYSGTLNTAGTGLQNGTAGYILNNSGMVFNSDSINGIVQILTADTTSTINGISTSVPKGTITARSAIFGTTSGAWVISASTNPGVMSSTTSAGSVYLDSTTPRVYAQAASGASTYSVGFRLLPDQTKITEPVIWAGNAGLGSSSNQFVVQADGALKATGAVISGVVAATTLGVGAQSSASITGATANGSTSVSYTTSSATGWSTGQTIVVTGVNPTSFNIGGTITSVSGTTVNVTSSTVVANAPWVAGGTARVTSISNGLTFDPTSGLRLYANTNSYMTFDATNGFKIAAVVGGTTNFLQFDGTFGFRLTGGGFNIGDGTANSIILKASPTPTISMWANQTSQGQIMSIKNLTNSDSNGIVIHSGNTPETIVFPAIYNYSGGGMGSTIALVQAAGKGIFLNATTGTIEGYTGWYSNRHLRNAIAASSYTTGTAGTQPGDILLVTS